MAKKKEREYVETFRDGDMVVDVYKDEDGYIMDCNYEDDTDYEDIYGPTDVSGEYDHD